MPNKFLLKKSLISGFLVVVFLSATPVPTSAFDLNTTAVKASALTANLAQDTWDFYFTNIVKPMNDGLQTIISLLFSEDNFQIVQPENISKTIPTSSTPPTVPTNPPSPVVVVGNQPSNVIYNQGTVGPQGPQGIQGPVGPRGPSGSSNSSGVSQTDFDNQTNGLLNSIENGIGGLSDSISEEVNTETLNVSGSTTLAGNLNVTGITTLTGSLSVGGAFDPGLTLGSVYFQGATGIAQDNANLFWNDTTNILTAGGFAGPLTGNVTGNLTGNADTVTNATLTTALTVNGGTLTLTANALNTSALTIGAGAVSVSGSNTGDQDLSGYVPYTGATTAVDLGAQTLTTTGYIDSGPIYVSNSDSEMIGPTFSSSPVLKLKEGSSHIGVQDALLVADSDNNTTATISAEGIFSGTSVISPTIIGGSATTQDLTFQTTSGVGATGADMHFLVGNNGATEALTILNNGNVGIGTATPTALLSVKGRTDFGRSTANLTGTVATNGTTTITGTNTKFLEELDVGDTINISGETSRVISTIQSDTTLTLTVASSTTASGLTYASTAITPTIIGSNGRILLPNGTALKPSLTFGGENDATGTGIYGSNASIGVSIGGTNYWTYNFFGQLAGSTTQNANPSLIVTQSSASATANTDAIWGVVNSGTNTSGAGIRGKSLVGYGGYFETNGASANPVVYINGSATHTGALLSLNANTSNKFIVLNNGNVGIGTTAPLLKLDVAGSGRFTGTATSVLTGTIDPAASTTVTGVGTLFTTELVVGDRITVTGETRTVTAIATNTSLTVDTAFSDNANDTAPDKLAAIFVTRLSNNNIGMVQNDLGNVGIGTTGPSSKIHILTGNTDGLRVESSNSGYIELGKTAGTRWAFRNDYTGSGLFEITYGTGGAVPGITALSINSANNNLSIGTTNSGSRFNVNGGVSIGNSYTSTAAPTNGAVIEGNVGIGTTTPGNKLTVTAPTTADALADVMIGISATTQKGLVIQAKASQTANLQEWQNSAGTKLTSIDSTGALVNVVADCSKYVLFSTSDTYIKNTSCGARFPFLGIGTDPNAGYAIIINYNGNSGGVTYGVNSTVTNISTGGVGGFYTKRTHNNAGTATNAYGLNIDTLTVSAGAVTNNYGAYLNPGTAGVNNYGVYQVGATVINQFEGKVGIGTTPTYALDVLATGTGVIARFNSTNATGCTLADGGTITCTSDERMKKNIEDITYGLETVKGLRPVLFNWKYEDDSTSKNLGFIAQEVEALVPKLIATDEEGMKSLNTTAMVPILTKALQDIDNKILEINNTEQENDWRDSIVAWFGNVGNGVGEIFANVFNAKEKICVDGECLTKEDVRALLLLVNPEAVSPGLQSDPITTPTPPPQGGEDTTSPPDAGGVPEGGGGIEEPTSEPTPDPIVEPTSEPGPALEPVVEPSPEPALEPTI